MSGKVFEKKKRNWENRSWKSHNTMSIDEEKQELQFALLCRSLIDYERRERKETDYGPQDTTFN